MALAYASHPLVSCHALIRRDGAVLLVKRANPPFAGYWSLPGGGVHLGENLSDALRREVREETALEVEPGRLLGYLDGIQRDDSDRVRYHYVMIYLEARVTGGSLAAGDDAREAVWMTPPEARRSLVTDSVLHCFEWAGM